jgi:hypothetical protein
VAVGRDFEFNSPMLCPDASAFDVMREAFLIAVKIDGADLLTIL